MSEGVICRAIVATRSRERKEIEGLEPLATIAVDDVVGGLVESSQGRVRAQQTRVTGHSVDTSTHWRGRLSIQHHELIDLF